MQARVKWVEGLTFLGESASGHQILMDGNSGDKAPSPMEMVLMAAGVAVPSMWFLFCKKGVRMWSIVK
ncbi:OsmC family protein [Escherichia coli]|nr:OsmC family protein [Escherichia coli]